MKYPKEIMSMSLRLGHTPEYLILRTVRSNYNFILYYILITLFLVFLFFLSLNGYSENTIFADIICTFGLVSSLVSLIILNVLSIVTVIRSVFDKENLAIEILTNEQKEYEQS